MIPVRALGVTLGLIVSGFAWTEIAGARSAFADVAAVQLDYKTRSNTALAQSGCQLCHIKPTGDAPWNPFGLAVGFWRGKKQNVSDAMYSALRYGGDTDRDGFPDALERFAGTDPQNRDSKPSEDLETLRKRFDAALEAGTFRLDVDVDMDGVSDALEVFAGTLPGDSTSKPSEGLEALRVRFEQAGGIRLYAPKTP
jgi:hypothetical protein